MKKRNFILIFTILTFICMPFMATLSKVSANDTKNQLSVFENLTHEIFGGVKVQSCEYLYGLDEEPDYIYVDLLDQGYVIYHEDTMDILEYSLNGDSPYENIKEKKYYAGPTSYFIKDGEEYVDLSNGMYAAIVESCARYASKKGCTNSSNEESNIKSAKLDTKNLIPATPPGATAGGYIPNAQYFINNPTHGANEHGTCGSVAAQLLLSYNNYNVDRRIIAPEYLNGDWENTLGNNDVFDPMNYKNPSLNPNACFYPDTTSSEVLGSNVPYYKHIIANLEPTALSCVDTVTTISVDASTGITTITVEKKYPDGTVEHISTTPKPTESGEFNSKETEHSHGGSMGGAVVNGISNVLKSRINENEFEIKHDSRLLNSIDSEPIKAEIDAGRPLIIGMSEILGGSNHWVVGYGYQDYTYPTGHPNAGETYSGYVVHFGWSNKQNVWINESWCNEYISLRLTHEHDLSIDTKIDFASGEREVRCAKCGYRTVDELFSVSQNGVLTDCKYAGVGQIDIPSQIDGITVTSIGNNAFADQSGISGISLPDSITNIGDNAFAGCTSLASINIPYGVTSIGAGAFSDCSALQNISISKNITSIGAGAFAGCTNLNISVASNNMNYTVQDNILYNKAMTEIIGAGTIAADIIIPDTITKVGETAFKGNLGLQRVDIYGTPVIGEFAFYGCPNLRNVYFYSYIVPQIGASAFAENNFTLYVPHSKQNAYIAILAAYVNNITSIPIKVTLKVDGEIYEELNTYYGAIVSSSPYKTGYSFNYWVDDIGRIYETDGVWDSTVDLTVNASFDALQFLIHFVGEGSDNLPDKTVTYGLAIGELPQISIIGKTFCGWKDEHGAIYTASTIWSRTSDLVLTSDVMPILYTVILDKRGGSGGSDSVKANYMAPMFDSEAPTRTNYLFKGYFAEPDGRGKQYYDDQMNSVNNWDKADDATIYAHWEGKSTKITFVKQGGSGGSDSVVAKYGEAMPAATAPTLKNYIFVGYFTKTGSGGAKYYDGPSMVSVKNWDMVESNGVTLYAHWHGVRYNIIYKNMTFMGNEAYVAKKGGSANLNLKEYEYGTRFALSDVYAVMSPASPYSPTLVFLGWYADKNFKTKVTEISDTSTGDKILYAKWRYDFSQGCCLNSEYTITDEKPYTKNYYHEIWISMKYNDLYQELKDIGINYVYIEFKLQIREVDDGYQEIYIFKGSSPTSNPIWSVTDIEHCPGSVGTTPKYYIWRCAFSIDMLKDCDELYIRYSAHGWGSDTWKAGPLYTDVMFTTSTNSDEDQVAFTWDYRVSIKDEDCIPLSDVSKSL